MTSSNRGSANVGDRPKFQSVARAMSVSQALNRTTSGVSLTSKDEGNAPKGLVNPDELKWTPQFTLNAFEDKLGRSRQKASLVFYIIFLSVFFYVTFDSRDVLSANLATRALRDALFQEEFLMEDSHIRKDFFDIGDQFEFWQWAEGPLVNALTVNETTNGSPTNQNPYAVYQYNFRVGAVRFRQVRVKNTTCITDPIYYGLTTDCWAQYNSETADTDSYGPYLQYQANLASDIWGRFGSWYDGGGYPVDILSTDDLGARVTELREIGWVDLQTRAVFVHLNFFNPNTRHFLVVTGIVEFNHGGGTGAWVQWRAIRLHPYLTDADFVRMVFEGFFFVILIAYTTLELKEFVQSPVKYLRDPWNAVDLINLFTFAIALAVYARYFTSPLRNDEALGRPEYVPLHEISTLYLRVYDVLAFNILLSCIKLFKYLQFNDQMSLMWRTLGKAWPDLRVFIIFFLIILLGFGLFANLLFGPDLANYRNTFLSLITIIQIVMGEFNYDEMAAVNRLLAPVFFVSFIILVFFTLVNIFLAILNDAFSYEKKRSRSSERSFGDLVRGFYHSFKRKRSRKIPNRRIKEVLNTMVAEHQADEMLTVDQMKSRLRVYAKDADEEARLLEIVDQMADRYIKKLEIEMEAEGTGVVVLGSTQLSPDGTVVADGESGAAGALPAGAIGASGDFREALEDLSSRLDRSMDAKFHRMARLLQHTQTRSASPQPPGFEDPKDSKKLSPGGSRARSASKSKKSPKREPRKSMGDEDPPPPPPPEV